jgi:hypothetical protein
VHACHVHLVDVVGVPQTLDVPVLVGLGDEPHRHAALDGRNHRVRMRFLRDPIHDHVDLLGLELVVLLGPSLVVLQRHEHDRRIDRIGRIGACKRRGDVCVVRVCGGIGPEVVVALHETVNDSRIVAEVDDLVRIVLVRRHRREGPGAVVGAAELDGGLPGEHHHLVVHDAGGGPPSDGNPGVLEFQHALRADGIDGVDARVNQHADAHAAVPGRDDLARVARIFEKPESDVDLDRFFSDEVDQDCAAILEGWIAHPLRGRRCRDAEDEEDGEERAPYSGRHRGAPHRWWTAGERPCRNGRAGSSGQKEEVFRFGRRT